MRKPGSRGPETLRNLHSAAIQLLAERSYQGMNLRLLASKLGLQAGSLYNYIDSKQQLLFWLMKDTTEKLFEGFQRTIATIADPADQMRKFVAFHVSYHIANRKESSVLMTEMHYLTPANFRAVKQIQRQYTDAVQAIVERGIAAGEFSIADARIATFVLIQMLTSVAQWYTPRGRLSADELVAVYTDLALAMLRSKEPVATLTHTNGHGKVALPNGNGKTPHSNGNGHQPAPITHSIDLGAHVLQVSITSHPKTSSKTRDASDDSASPPPASATT